MMNRFQILLQISTCAATAGQRAGRAGRVRAGTCYALYTAHRAASLMRHHQVPEMHRVPLTEIVLQIKKLGVGQSAEAFLAGALEPPAPLAVAGGSLRTSTRPTSNILLLRASI